MRRRPEQLIQAALGDPDFVHLEPDESRDKGRFRFYSAMLPGDRYSGLPPRWYFGVLPSPEKPTSREQVEDVLRDARALVRDAVGLDLVPLVLLSDDPAVPVANKLRWEDKLVFFIEDHNLPVRAELPSQVRNAPLLRAVREKLDHKHIKSLFFEPYRPGEPVEGWQFFGRREELDRIVNTTQSFVIIGPRRIGKTSLLRETARQLNLSDTLKDTARRLNPLPGTRTRVDQRSVAVYLSLQHLQTPEEVIEALVRALSPRDMEAAVRRHKVLNEGTLRSALQALSANYQRATVILDELGNVIQKNRQDDWRMMGVLREYAHSSRVQIIMSGFQEFFLKQLEDLAGPYVNLAHTMPLGVFSDSDVDEFIVGPLALWGNIPNKRRFRDLVVRGVGKHPFLLQHLGRALFTKVFENGSADLETTLEKILSKEAGRIFASAINEIFHNVTPAAQRYIFLLRCQEAEAERSDVTGAELTDLWVKSALKTAGYESTFDGRRLLLESMEMGGLTEPVDGNRSRQRIVSPIIWHTQKSAAVHLIETFAEEMHTQKDLLKVRA